MTGILLAAFIAVNADVPLGTNGISDTARFVKTFECRDVKAVRRATWTVSGLGVFRAYLNGQEVGAEDCLKPGLTHILIQTMFIRHTSIVRCRKRSLLLSPA